MPQRNNKLSTSRIVRIIQASWLFFTIVHFLIQLLVIYSLLGGQGMAVGLLETWAMALVLPSSIVGLFFESLAGRLTLLIYAEIGLEGSTRRFAKRFWGTMLVFNGVLITIGACFLLMS